MKKLNSTLSSPLRFVFDDGTTVGQFYNSKDSKYHLAKYVPFRSPPSKYLCGGTGNFSPSGVETYTHKRKRCEDCFKRVASFNGEATGS